MKLHPSSDPVVEKAQHEPHCPWFLIGVTAPAVAQLTLAGKASTSSWVGTHSSPSSCSLSTRQEIWAENSAVFKSAN